MKYRLDDVKDIIDFVYRESLPDNPDAGTFYWIEDGNNVALYFADSRCNLVRLDNINSSDISEDDLSDELKNKINRIISETDLSDELKNKINRIDSFGSLSELTDAEVDEIFEDIFIKGEY